MYHTWYYIYLSLSLSLTYFFIYILYIMYRTLHAAAASSGSRLNYRSYNRTLSSLHCCCCASSSRRYVYIIIVLLLQAARVACTSGIPVIFHDSFIIIIVVAEPFTFFCHTHTPSLPSGCVSWEAATAAFTQGRNGNIFCCVYSRRRIIV